MFCNFFIFQCHKVTSERVYTLLRQHIKILIKQRFWYKHLENSGSCFSETDAVFKNCIWSPKILKIDLKFSPVSPFSAKIHKNQHIFFIYNKVITTRVVSKYTLNQILLVVIFFFLQICRSICRLIWRSWRILLCPNLVTISLKLRKTCMYRVYIK